MLYNKFVYGWDNIMYIHKRCLIMYHTYILEIAAAAVLLHVSVIAPRPLLTYSIKEKHLGLG